MPARDLQTLALTITGLALLAMGSPLAAQQGPKATGTATGTIKVNPQDGQKYVWIEAGTFRMGCSEGDNDCDDDEKPAHTVTIGKGFWIGQTEVTVGAYKRFSQSGGGPMPEEPKLLDRNLNPAWQQDSQPIMEVTWEQAGAFCQWVGGRLPTEAEWEYAARGGSGAARSGPLDDSAWYADNSGNARLDSTRLWQDDPLAANYRKRVADNGNRPHDVAQKKPNGYGLYDVLGNVWEWTGGWYDKDYYAQSPSQDPKGPPSGQFRVVRGGGWYYAPRIERVSYRWRFESGGYWNYFGLGFRCIQP